MTSEQAPSVSDAQSPAQQQRLASDPRNPSRISTYNIAVDGEPSGDWAALLGLLLGIIGLTMRIKIMAWGSLFCSLTSIANIKAVEFEFKQIFSTLAFSILSIVLNYLVPAH